MTTTESPPNDVLAQHSLSEKDVPSTHSTNNEDNSGPLMLETVENTEYVTGLKLLAVVGSVTLACFLLLLDLSILSTVSPTSLPVSTACAHHHRLRQ